MAPLTCSDLQMFQRFGIDLDLGSEAHVQRLTDAEARKYGFTASLRESLDGIVFPYYSLATGKPVTARLRRDDPDGENGKEKKYVTLYDAPRDLYFPPRAREKLADPTTVVVPVESEKAALALTAWAKRTGRNILAVAMGGCFGWRCHFKEETRDGWQVHERGVLPSLKTVTHDREVVIMLDSNRSANPLVKKAEHDLAATLLAYNARVRIAALPAADGKINGPDDAFDAFGLPDADALIAGVFDQARSVPEVIAEDIERAIQATSEADGTEKKSATVNYACELIARVQDKIARECYLSGLARATYRLIPKAEIGQRIEAKIAQHRQERIEQERILKKAVTPRVDARQLVLDLYHYFFERLYVPREAALMLAYFVINSWTFEIFDTCPYLLVESATMRCGKTTTVRLLDAVCCRSRSSAALTEATAFRIVDVERGSLMIDEAETLESKSERAQAIRAICQVGYQKGSQVPRCDGEEHEIRWYEAYPPKVYSLIGGLTGALLDRCLVLHMERAPKNHIRKPARIRAVRNAAAELVPRLEAYAEQNADGLRQLYEDEPDAGYWSEITDREHELWGPLLLHAKLMGNETEKKLLRIAARFGKQKAEIESIDYRTAQTIDLYNAIQHHPNSSFTPGELVDALLKSEAWAYPFAKVKGHDEDSIRLNRAIKVGYFLSSFRFDKTKNGNGRMSYDRKLVLEGLERYVPQPDTPNSPPNSPANSPSNSPSTQVVDNTACCDVGTETTESTETFAGQPGDSVSDDPNDDFVEVEI